MKTPLFLSILAAGCLTAVAQTTPAPAAPVRPAPIDPVRFRQYDVNHDGKLDLREQVYDRRGSVVARSALTERRYSKTMARGLQAAATFTGNEHDPIGIGDRTPLQRPFLTSRVGPIQQTVHAPAA